MKKYFIYFFAFPLIFSSCSKDDNNNGVPLTESDIIGIWELDDYMLDNQSIMCPSSASFVTNCIIDQETIFYDDNSSLNITNYEDGQNTMSVSMWSINSDNKLRLVDEEGGTTIWTCNAINNSKLEISCSDIPGMEYSAIIKATKTGIPAKK